MRGVLLSVSHLLIASWEDGMRFHEADRSDTHHSNRLPEAQIWSARWIEQAGLN